jgi:hypothetical protein
MKFTYSKRDIMAHGAKDGHIPGGPIISRAAAVRRYGAAVTNSTSFQSQIPVRRTAHHHSLL